MAPSFAMRTAEGIKEARDEGKNSFEQFVYGVSRGYLQSLIEKGGIQEDIAQKTVQKSLRDMFSKGNVKTVIKKYYEKSYV